MLPAYESMPSVQNASKIITSRNMVLVAAMWLAIAGLAFVGHEVNKHQSKMEPQIHYIGLECYPGSIYADPYAGKCEFGCLPESNCTMWRTGKPLWGQTTKSKRVWKYNKSETDVEYKMGPDNVHMISNKRNYHIFTQSEAIQCLKDRRIVFSGDSMVRQLFLRIVAWFRDLPSVSEHYFHDSASYTFSREKDELHIGEFQWPRNRSAEDDGVLFRMAFFFESDAILLKQSFNELNADVLVAGINYWVSQVVTYDMLVDPGYYILDRLNQTRPYKKTEEFGVSDDVAFYWYATPPLGGHSVYERNEESFGIYTLRNELMRGTVRYINKMANRSIAFVLPSDTFDLSRQFPRNVLEDGGFDNHFMCGYQPMFPEPIDYVKTDPKEECQDLFDYNLMQVLLNSLCG